MEQPVNPNVVTSPTTVPIGPGGLARLIFRRLVMVLTGGMAYPNAWVEGLDPTALQKQSMGTLYDKKP